MSRFLPAIIQGSGYAISAYVLHLVDPRLAIVFGMIIVTNVMAFVAQIQYKKAKYAEALKVFEQLAEKAEERQKKEDRRNGPFN